MDALLVPSIHQPPPRTPGKAHINIVLTLISCVGNLIPQPYLKTYHFHLLSYVWQPSAYSCFYFAYDLVTSPFAWVPFVWVWTYRIFISLFVLSSSLLKPFVVRTNNLESSCTYAYLMVHLALSSTTPIVTASMVIGSWSTWWEHCVCGHSLYRA